MIKEYNYYTGFEGEPEILVQINHRDVDNQTIIRIWSGYFDSLIGFISPNKDGEWSGLALYYHTDTGWYEDDLPWICNEKELFLVQLESIKHNLLDNETSEVLRTLIKVFKESISLEEQLIFSLE